MLSPGYHRPGNSHKSLPLLSLLLGRALGSGAASAESTGACAGLGSALLSSEVFFCISWTKMVLEHYHPAKNVTSRKQQEESSKGAEWPKVAHMQKGGTRAQNGKNYLVLFPLYLSRGIQTLHRIPVSFPKSNLYPPLRSSTLFVWTANINALWLGRSLLFWGALGRV